MADVRVQVNEVGIQRFLNDPNGPIAKDLFKRGQQVYRIAYSNVSGSVLNVLTGNLRNNLEVLLEPARDGITVIVGTTAVDHQTQFGYPRYYDRLAAGEVEARNTFMPDKPWLRSALREVFS